MRSFYDKTNVGIGLANMLFTLFVGIVITMHDFEYCYILKDYLAKRESIANIFFFFTDMVLCALIKADIGQVNFITFSLFLHPPPLFFFYERKNIYIFLLDLFIPFIISDNTYKSFFE